MEPMLQPGDHRPSAGGESLLRAALDALPSHVAVLDEQGNILLVNEAWRRFGSANGNADVTFGVGSSYAGVCDAAAAACPDAAQTARGIRAVLDGAREQFELEYECHAGAEQRWFLLRVAPLRSGDLRLAVTVHINITARKMVELEIAKSEARFRQLADAMPQIVWTARPDGTLDYHNRRWYELTGAPEGSAPDYWVPALHPDDQQKCLDLWSDSVRTGKPFQCEYRLRLASGEYRWHLGRGVCQLDAEERVKRWFGTCTDVEDQKRAEAALRETDRRKDEFLTVLAHELRNPLAPLRSSLDIIRRRGVDPTLFPHLCEVMDRQVKQLVRLVDDLLDVSRTIRGKIVLRTEPVRLEEVISTAVDTARPLIESRRHALEVAVDRDVPAVLGDATRLAQVFGNLLNNAAKYTDVGGHIRIEARRSGAQAVVHVEDDGVGIAADALPLVFDLFRQETRSLDRSMGGLGVGLTLARQLLQMHGGTVEAFSEGPGRGSRFTVRLPALAEKPLPEAAPPPLQRAAVAHRVMVVDDNVDAAEMLAELLGLLGHEVATAHDGLNAVSRALTFRPDVMFLDLALPKLDGYGVFRRLRDEPSLERTLVIALSGFGDETEKRRVQEAGFRYHLVKPVEIDDLMSVFHSLPPAPD
jgi:PAS domain S-box-containing protein